MRSQVLGSCQFPVEEVEHDKAGPFPPIFQQQDYPRRCLTILLMIEILHGFTCHNLVNNGSIVFHWAMQDCKISSIHPMHTSLLPEHLAPSQVSRSSITRPLTSSCEWPGAAWGSDSLPGFGTESEEIAMAQRHTSHS